MPRLRRTPGRRPPVRGLQPVHAPARAWRQLPALRRARAHHRPARHAATPARAHRKAVRHRDRARPPAAGGPVSAPAAPPVAAELEALVRRMRLPYLRKAAPDVLATARAQRWEPAEVLRVLLAEEVTGRDAATRRMRRKTAGFPAGKTFSSWRPEESSVPAATQDALATL